MNPEYLSPAQVAHYFPGLTADRLARWRWARTGPEYMKVGRQLLYRRDAIEAYLIANTIGHSSTECPR